MITLVKIQLFADRKAKLYILKSTSQFYIQTPVSWIV